MDLLHPAAVLALTATLAAQSLGKFEPKPDDEPVVPLPNAHAHNDYSHDPPLTAALAHGCMSVEVDIHLIDGELRVAHDREDCVPGRTLEHLYLEPLAKRVARNGGRVFKGGPREFQLLIDFKSTGATTYAALKPGLARHASMLTRFSGKSRRAGAVLVVLSGGAPDEVVLADKQRLCALDGWFHDIEKGRTANQVPLLSASWLTHFRWLGHGPFSDAEREKLRQFVERAHRSGRKIRFWAVPNRRTIWKEQRDAGVDWLNIDNLPAGQEFLLDRRQTGQAGHR